MKMNLLETMAMNNPFRAAIQRYMELPILTRLGGDLAGKQVLEIGCGRGYGTRCLIERLRAGHVVATDADEAMLRRARRRLKRYGPDRIEIRREDAQSLSFGDCQFDAIVDLAALHHCEDWKRALAETARVLKPGGQLLFEEVARQWIERWPYRVLFDHPVGNRFSAEEWLDACEAAGLHVGANRLVKRGGDFIFGVAVKAEAPERSGPEQGGHT